MLLPTVKSRFASSLDSMNPGAWFWSAGATPYGQTGGNVAIDFYFSSLLTVFLHTVYTATVADTPEMNDDTAPAVTALTIAPNNIFSSPFFLIQRLNHRYR